MKNLFITGATGFIGRYLLLKLAHNKSNKIYCLTRQNTALLPELLTSENIHFLQGGIFDSNIYRTYLDKCDVVIHLAAITGKAGIEEYFKVNAEGTQLLVHECEKSNVKRFLYISSIAAKFRTPTNYYYAQSKKQGEIAVKQSRLNYTIVRPTIVIGQEAYVWQNLDRLARGPYPVIFGDGKTNIQPVFIEDLITCLISIIDDNTFLNEEIDLGGPEIIGFGTFLQKIYEKYYGKTSRILHIPLQPLIVILRLLEKNFYDYLPLNVGQLSSFSNDSVIEENRLYKKVRPQMRNIEQMLDIVINLEKVDRRNQLLINECKVFCKYLIQMDPNSNVINHYRKAHETQLKGPDQQCSFFESALLYIARMNAFGTGLVDAYTNVFVKKTRIRQKLILMLAILECSHPYYLILDTPNSRRYTVVCLKFLIKTISYTANLLLASLILGPLQIACYFQSKLLNLSKKAI